MTTRSRIVKSSSFSVHDENTHIGGKPTAKPTERRSALGSISSNTLLAREESKTIGLRKPQVQVTEPKSTLLPKPDSSSFSAAVAKPQEQPLFSIPLGDEDILDFDVEDIDACDIDNPQAVTEYTKEIYRFLWRTEGNLAPSTTYIVKQTDINEKMRSILVDWLVDVHLKFKLRTETLFLTINIIDRFLSKQNVSRQKLQLLGVAAMLIASKYEEIYAPEVRDFVYISDKAYTREEILKMESLILSKLDFRLTVATPWTFFKRFCKVAKADASTEMLANFILERSLIDYQMLKYVPSMMVSSALYLANEIRGNAPWNPLLARYTHYSDALLQPCVSELRALVSSSPSSSLKAVYRKYCHTKYLEVAKLIPRPE